MWGVCVCGGAGAGGAPGENKPFYRFDSLSVSFWMRLFHIKEKSCLPHGVCGNFIFYFFPKKIM